ncbi:MAG: site-2 protease family protein, partial [Candidatus Omnitrophota bacterium]
LPFPVLDGGHLAFLLLEKLRGRPLSARAENIVGNAGMYALILMAVFVTYNDVLRFFGDRIKHFFR